MTQTHNPRERLNHLLELAAQGEAGRAALLDELADILLDWPHDYAQAMRAPFEVLLEKTAREVDGKTRAALAERLAGHEELPVTLLNEFFFDAPAPLRLRILARNEALDGEAPDRPVAADACTLVAAARKTMNGAFAEFFAAALSLPRATAKEILDDASGLALAVACKGTGIDRAAFSAIAVLSTDRAGATDRLAAYDDIPRTAAERLTGFWRERG